jgi:hypothetical protein
MDPHYYNGNEFAMNFEERNVSFANFLSRLLASQARNFPELDKRSSNLRNYDLGTEGSEWKARLHE